MYRISSEKKNDPPRRWVLPDRVFFACGACHILVYAFLDRYEVPGAQAIWIKPDPGFTGNHIIVATDDWVFDHHGYSEREAYFKHLYLKAERWWPGWSATLKDLPKHVLISESLSKTYEGLWLREPRQFLRDALPRAAAFLDRFPEPPRSESPHAARATPKA